MIANLLSSELHTWTTLEDAVAAPYRYAYEVLFKDYSNRIVIAGNQQYECRGLGAAIRARLQAFRSRQAACISIRTLKEDV